MQFETLSIWMPKRYSSSEDFELWLRRFEAYCAAVGVTDETKCSLLFSGLDDNAFRAMGLSEDVTADYDGLNTALIERFAPTTNQF